MHKLSAVSILALGAGLAASGLAGSQDPADVTVKVTHVGGSVHMLEGQGGNIGLSIGEDGVLMIDSQFSRLSEKIRAAIEEAAGSDEVRILVNTHWHGDHTGGNTDFGPAATILAHHNVRSRMLTGAPGRPVDPELPAGALPVVTFERGVTIHFNGEEVQVLHMPAAHTDGDSVVLFTESKVAHLGDLFFSGLLPFVDVASGGDVLGLAADVEEILHGLPDDVKIVPGHGPLSTTEDLRTYLRMLKETTGHVREAMKAGKSLEELQEAGLPEEWKSWAWGFIDENRWIEIIHQSLTRSPVAPRETLR